MRGNEMGSSRVKSGFALVLSVATLCGCGADGPRPPAGDTPLATSSQRLLSYGDHSYFISTTARTWGDANRACADMDMTLVTLDDAAEEQWLVSQMPTTATEWWLGINDLGTEGLWTWVGAPSTYTHWNPGEPNAATTAEDCGLHSASGGWNDLSCTVTRLFVCESVPPRAAQYDGHDYLFFTAPKPWAQARSTCLASGYDLVSINDAAEDTWLKTQVPSLLTSWIGFTDQAQEGVWRWSNGLPVTYSNWRRYEPNDTNGAEDCAVNNAPVTSSAAAGGWNDIPCGEYVSFICEATPAPEGYGQFTYQATATASATQGTRDYDVWLEAGQTLEIGTCGLPTAYTTKDTFLRLLGPDGLEVAANDDDCKGQGSRFRYRVPACGAGGYVVKAGCYDTGTCDGRVVFRIIPAPTTQP